MPRAGTHPHLLRQQREFARGWLLASEVKGLAVIKGEAQQIKLGVLIDLKLDENSVQSPIASGKPTSMITRNSGQLKVCSRPVFCRNSSQSYTFRMSPWPEHAIESTPPAARYRLAQLRARRREMVRNIGGASPTPCDPLDSSRLDVSRIGQNSRSTIGDLGARLISL